MKLLMFFWFQYHYNWVYDIDEGVMHIWCWFILHKSFNRWRKLKFSVVGIALTQSSAKRSANNEKNIKTIFRSTKVKQIQIINIIRLLLIWSTKQKILSLQHTESEFSLSWRHKHSLTEPCPIFPKRPPLCKRWSSC